MDFVGVDLAQCGSSMWRRVLALILALSVSTISTAENSLCAEIFKYARVQHAQETTRFYSTRTFVERMKGVLKPALKAEDFTFTSRTLTQAQLKALSRFSSKAGKPLIKGDQIRVVAFEEMLRNVSTKIGIQQVSSNGPVEQRLLELSNIDTRPKEVLMFLLHLADGRVEQTPILIEGSINSVDFDAGTFQLYNYLRGNVTGLVGIECIHTHPTYALSVASLDGTSKFRANELSDDDYAAAADFALRFPRGMFIRIKAVLPNGFNYQMDIPTGR